MCDGQDTGTLMTQAVPEVSCQQTQALVWQYYGLQGDVALLTGERDKNFCLTVPSGRRYMLKVINAAESVAESHYQTALLLHVAQQAAALPVPRVILTRYQQAEPVVDIGGIALRMRLVSFLEGTPLHAVTPSTTLMESLGSTLAQLDVALSRFSHPAEKRQLLWDISRAEQIRPYLEFVQDAEQQRAITHILQRYDSHVAPQLKTLRQQTIHNDMNPHNVLADVDDATRVSGIIDFGDALYAPLINDLATALAYQVHEGDDPFAFIVPFTASYHAHLPLTEQEIALLPDLIMTRLALIMTIAQWRAARYPENRDYLLRNLPRSWRSLQQITRYSHDQFCQRIWQGVKEINHV